MEKVIISPGKYIQGDGAMNNLKKYADRLGKKPLLIADGFVLNLVREAIIKQYNDEILIYEFGGECSKKEINKLNELVEEHKIDIVIGIGGGKTLDTAKAVGFYSNIRVIVAPTIASTDAPTSALSVIYTEDGEFEEYLFVNCNPDIVLIDVSIVANAPAKLLASGIGDALSTYFEARACTSSFAISMAGGLPTLCSFEIAKLCYKTLLNDAVDAYKSCEENLVTPALENIIEANTYLSGIGFESSGLAAAHSIHNGLTIVEQLHNFTHGEKVAFGTLVQLVIENDHENYSLVKNLCKEISLPVCFKDFGCEDISDDKIMEVAKKACEEGETIHNMPMQIDPKLVYNAIKLANKLGSE